MEFDTINIMVECLPEFTPIEGNCSAIDEETDAKTERWIKRQLDNGNQWAWCTVKVTVKWGKNIGNDYLGCCSYKSFEDFKNGVYYEEMVENAFQKCLGK